MDMIVVSVSDFRNNLLEYGNLAKAGKTVVVKNEKTEAEFFRVTPPKELSVEEEIKIIKKYQGFLANEPPDTNRAKLRRLDMAYGRRLKKGLV